MFTHYPPRLQPATTEYVLEVIRDEHRQQCEWDPEADPGVTLSFSSTVADWRRACDLVPAAQLGEALNRGWGMEASPEEWAKILEPAKKRTLSDVCAFIAARAQSPKIRPVTLFGRRCLVAGAFLTVRSILVEAGAHPQEIRPSTPLAEFARSYCPTFLGPISRLAPGALPLIKVQTRLYDAATRGSVISGLIVPVALWQGNFVLAVVAILLALFCYAVANHAAIHLLPSSVQFGDLKTFRDLSTVLADATEETQSAAHSC
jgi:hypothetical protein